MGLKCLRKWELIERIKRECQIDCDVKEIGEDFIMVRDSIHHREDEASNRKEQTPEA
jgi:hypothetical protein